MIEKLRELGIRIDYGEVQAVAGKEIVGRPHFAQILVQKGVVGSVKGAFEQYLGSGKPAYIRKKRLIAEEGIQLIRDAGGVPCLAHPALYGFKDDGELEVVISRLKSFGMEGIETYYSTHTQNQTELYKQLAEKYGLVECGGSDFHGSAKPEIKLGRGIEDNLKIGWDIYLNLHQRHQKLHAHYASNRIK
jgi:predicted metal-dependent phosphoesterase TrpH